MLGKKREKKKKRKKTELKFSFVGKVKYPFTAPSEDVMLSKQTKFWSVNNY